MHRSRADSGLFIEPLKDVETDLQSSSDPVAVATAGHRGLFTAGTVHRSTFFLSFNHTEVLFVLFY